MQLVKQAGVVVGLVSGLAGLLFLFFPQLRPERHSPPANQSAAIVGLVTNRQTTKGQFLTYSDESKLGFTKQQLAVMGASVFARLKIVGYRGKKLTIERQVVNAATGDVVGQARDFLVTPGADSVSNRWWDWTPLLPGRGAYIMVIKLLDERQTSAIACGQSRLFGGLAGALKATPPQLCELENGA